MIHCCEKCGFIFQRMGEVQSCPSCGGQLLRPATREEESWLESLLKRRKENEEEPT